MPVTETLSRFSRRDFVRIVAISGVAGLTAKYSLEALATKPAVSETRLLMGTAVNLTVVGDDPREARSIIQACLDQMASIESILSRHQTGSQLSLLNRQGYLAQPNCHLVNLVEQAAIISKRSAGAFDISIKPVVDLYQEHADNGHGLPDETAVSATLPLVNYANVHVSEDEIRFAREGMAITLDGIAKGYIVDEGVALLNDAGYANVLVEAGGDLFASGTAETDQPWRIGVQAPRPLTENILATFALHDQAAATSGDYMQTFTADFSQHHLLDPRTGYSAPELASVTVTAPSAMLADALATTVAVLGVQAGLDLIEQLPHTGAYLITKELEIKQSSRFSGHSG